MEILKRPSYRAMENKIREIFFAEVEALGLEDKLTEMTYISRDDECSSGKIPGWIYLLNIKTGTTIRLKFGFDTYSREFQLNRLIIDANELTLRVSCYTLNIFKLFNLGYYKPIVKIWLNTKPNDLQDLLVELNIIKDISIWDETHMKQTVFPKLHMPIFDFYLDKKMEPYFSIETLARPHNKYDIELAKRLDDYDFLEVVGVFNLDTEEDVVNEVRNLQSK